MGKESFAWGAITPIANSRAKVGEHSTLSTLFAANNSEDSNEDSGKIPEGIEDSSNNGGDLSTSNSGSGNNDISKRFRYKVNALMEAFDPVLEEQDDERHH